MGLGSEKLEQLPGNDGQHFDIDPVELIDARPLKNLATMMWSIPSEQLKKMDCLVSAHQIHVALISQWGDDEPLGVTKVLVAVIWASDLNFDILGELDVAVARCDGRDVWRGVEPKAFVVCRILDVDPVLLIQHKELLLDNYQLENIDNNTLFN